jgi:hypothetical protein
MTHTTPDSFCPRCGKRNPAEIQTCTPPDALPSVVGMSDETREALKSVAREIERAAGFIGPISKADEWLAIAAQIVRNRIALFDLGIYQPAAPQDSPKEQKK